MIGRPGRSSCDRLRPALIDHLDRGEAGPATAEALAHLDRCEDCRREAEGIALTIHALRRYGAALAHERAPASPPPIRQAQRLAQRPWARLLSPLSGVAVSLLLLVSFTGSAGVLSIPGDAPASEAAERADEAAEAAWLARERPLAGAPDLPASEVASSHARRLPDVPVPVRVLSTSAGQPQTTGGGPTAS